MYIVKKTRAIAYRSRCSYPPYYELLRATESLVSSRLHIPTQVAPEGQHHGVKMPRPISAGERVLRAPTAIEQEELLQKVRLLAEHHARNVQAFHRLRRSGSSSAHPNRTFTRVTASAPSSWKHESTVVEPFRCMEAHTAAWKRKMRRCVEVHALHSDVSDLFT